MNTIIVSVQLEDPERASARGAQIYIKDRLKVDPNYAAREICVQLQHEKSYNWGIYDETVRGIVNDRLAAVPKHEQEAMWLQTDAGIVWSCKEPDDRDEFPVDGDNIVEWLSLEYVYAEAERWSNARIRAYFERLSPGD